MAKKETASPAIPVFPMLKTVEQRKRDPRKLRAKTGRGARR